MSRFLSSFDKQIDAKGRVSIPASYRAAVTALGADRIFAFPSFADGSIECYPPPAYFDLLDRIERIVESPEAKEHLEVAVITRCAELPFDGEGRVVFPERLLKSKGIEKAVMFAGRGNRFQMWAPDAFDAFEGVAAKEATQHRHLLMGGASGMLNSALKPESAA